LINAFQIRTKKNSCAKRNDREITKSAVNKQPVEEKDEEEGADKSGDITVAR